MASPISALIGSSDPASSGNAAGIGASAPNEEMFLKLLVSQLQNQDPLNPTDSTQFVGQLAQFSQLEQLIAIRNDIEKPSGTAGGTQAPVPPADNSSISS